MMADGLCSNKRRWLWVPAFAGTTERWRSLISGSHFPNTTSLRLGSSRLACGEARSFLSLPLSGEGRPQRSGGRGGGDVRMRSSDRPPPDRPSAGHPPHKWGRDEDRRCGCSVQNIVARKWHTHLRDLAAHAREFCL